VLKFLQFAIYDCYQAAVKRLPYSK